MYPFQSIHCLLQLTVAVLANKMTARYLSPTGLDVYIVRHGESTNNAVQGADRAAYEQVRESDPGLSPLGRLQATHLGRYLAGNSDVHIHRGIAT